MGFRREYGRINVEVTVKRSELIERLMTSREKHQREFEQAIGLWRKDFSDVLAAIKVDKLSHYPQELDELERHCPECYLEAYDDIIEMFNMAVKDEILLDSEAFRNFCRDEWDWKSEVSSNKYYREVLKQK